VYLANELVVGDGIVGVGIDIISKDRDTILWNKI